MGNRPFLLYSPGIKSSEVEMAEGNQTASYELLAELTQLAIAQALDRHRRLGSDNDSIKNGPFDLNSPTTSGFHRSLF